MGKRRTFRRKTVMVKLSAYLGLKATERHWGSLEFLKDERGKRKSL